MRVTVSLLCLREHPFYGLYSPFNEPVRLWKQWSAGHVFDAVFCAEDPELFRAVLGAIVGHQFFWDAVLVEDSS